MEEENKIINWNNNLADLPFRNLTANEMDIFLAVCCECQKQKNNLVRIEFSKLERLGNFNACGKQRLGAYIESVFKNYLNFILLIEMISTMNTLLSLLNLELIARIILSRFP